MTMTAIDWDQWRRDYSSMGFAEHQAFNAECLRLHPHQQAFDAQACAEFLSLHQPKTVVELGGWDGALAAEMLDRFPGIQTWVNYDITPDVPQTCDDVRYDVIVLDDWPWRRHLVADALVASHVFEHLKAYQIEMLMGAWDVDRVFMDVPIGATACSWWGYEGSHILEVGYTDLLGRLRDAGYEPSLVEGTVAHLRRLA